MEIKEYIPYIGIGVVAASAVVIIASEIYHRLRKNPHQEKINEIKKEQEDARKFHKKHFPRNKHLEDKFDEDNN